MKIISLSKWQIEVLMDAFAMLAGEARERQIQLVASPKPSRKAERKTDGSPSDHMSFAV